MNQRWRVSRQPFVPLMLPLPLNLTPAERFLQSRVQRRRDARRRRGESLLLGGNAEIVLGAYDRAGHVELPSAERPDEHEPPRLQRPIRTRGDGAALERDSQDARRPVSPPLLGRDGAGGPSRDSAPCAHHPTLAHRRRKRPLRRLGSLALARGSV